jgi:D-alanyl-D-alanine endopeptidase (penicillin-binding protein 7)
MQQGRPPARGLATLLGCLLIAGLAASAAARPVEQSLPGQPTKSLRAHPAVDASAGTTFSGAMIRVAQPLEGSSRKRAGARLRSRQAASGPSGAHARIRTPLAAHVPEHGRTSVGQQEGLHAVDDPLELRSSVALVVDQASGEPFFEKNPGAVLPIASITKLMTAMVVLDAHQSLEETLEITADDIDTERFSRSRLKPGTRLTRAELLKLALMASENRAAHALGRSYPGGLAAWAAAANAKARALGMSDSVFIEPTGLSSRNVASARDLARMVRSAARYPEIRQYTTSSEYAVEPAPRARKIVFRNTNRLIDSPGWDIDLSKTGYIIEAGGCLVMQARFEGRSLIFVLLDADAVHARFADANRIKRWLERGGLEKAAGGTQPSIWRAETPTS